VGDISGAVRALCQVREVSSIVCLTGRNEQLASTLGEAFSHEPRVHVYGFTDRMPEVLTAADALVHSTGGVTCLEARATGTPVVSYGLPVGHARVNTRAMAALDLVRLAEDTAQLRGHVQASFDAVEAQRSQEGHQLPAAMSPAELVLAPLRRVRPIPAWRLRLAALLSQVLLLAAAGTWMMSTDEVSALAGMIVGERAVTRIATDRPLVGLIVTAPRPKIAAMADALEARGVHVAFADGSSTPPRALVAGVRSLGDGLVPEVPTSGTLLRWVRTSTILRSQARVLGLRHGFYFLQPPGGLTVGQMVLARTVDATAIKGAVSLTAREALPQRPLRAGDVLVVSADGSPSAVAGVERIASRLAREGLSAAPLGAL
jgi:hypothetical protein